MSAESPRRVVGDGSLTGAEAVMVEVQKRSGEHFAAKAERHRQMARAAIRVALRHGISDKEILAEYAIVQEVEARG